MSKQEKDDGGPAFPVPGIAGSMLGMSLRDWFVGHALSGLLASPKTEGMSPEIVAAEALAYADAVLAERAK